MKRAIQAAIPWVKKLLQNLRLSYPKHSRTSKACIPFDLTKCGSSGVSISSKRLQVIKDWYIGTVISSYWGLERQGYKEPVDCPDSMFEPALGIGMKHVGELLNHIEYMTHNGSHMAETE